MADQTSGNKQNNPRQAKGFPLATANVPAGDNVPSQQHTAWQQRAVDNLVKAYGKEGAVKWLEDVINRNSWGKNSGGLTSYQEQLDLLR